MEHNETQWNKWKTMENHGTKWIKMAHDTPYRNPQWNTTEHNGAQWNTIEDNGTQWVKIGHDKPQWNP